MSQTEKELFSKQLFFFSVFLPSAYHIRLRQEKRKSDLILSRLRNFELVRGCLRGPLNEICILFEPSAKELQFQDRSKRMKIAVSSGEGMSIRRK